MHDDEPKEAKQPIPTASAILADGELVELVYQPVHKRTALALFSAGRWTLQNRVENGVGRTLVPFSPNNNLIANEVLVLPSEPRIYGTEGHLVEDIQAFIHHYVDFTQTFEKIATHYVLLTWLYDAFKEVVPVV